MSRPGEMFSKGASVMWDMSTLGSRDKVSWPRDHGPGPFKVTDIIECSPGGPHTQILVFTDRFGRRQGLNGFWFTHA